MPSKAPRSSSPETLRVKSPAEIIQGRTFGEPQIQAMVREAVRATTAALIEQLWNPTVVPSARGPQQQLIPIPGRVARVEFPLSEREQGQQYDKIVEAAIARLLGTVQGSKVEKYEEPFGPTKSLSELATLHYSPPQMGFELSRVEEMPHIDLLNEISPNRLPDDVESLLRAKRVTWRVYREPIGDYRVVPKLIYDSSELHLIRLPITELTPGFTEKDGEGTPTIAEICETIRRLMDREGTRAA